VLLHHLNELNEHLNSACATLALPPLLVWGLVPRLVGVVFLISFISLWGQVLAISGSRGVIPFELRLRRYREWMTPWRRWTSFPSLLLLYCSDRMLQGLVAVGAACAVLVIYGGPAGYVGLLGCYLVYISLDKPIGLIFPWDCLLFEAAFLGLLLPSWSTLPHLHAAAVPTPLVAWCFRLLVVRCVLGFGRVKFTGSSWRDAAYLSGFLINQPLPSAVGWLLHKLPLPLLKAAVVFLFFAEIPLPLLGLHPTWGTLTAVGVGALMVGIGLCGTFGYFNVIAASLCVALLDTETPAQLFASPIAATAADALINGVAALQLLGGLLAFPFNSWVGQHWHHWPVFLRAPRPVQWLVGFYRALHPLRWVHPYGVFPPHTQPGAKVVPVVSVSWDGNNWQELEYPLACSQPYSRPRFIAPHHARGDQAVIYEAFGLNSQSLVNGLTLPGDPFLFTERSATHALLQRLLEGETYPGVYFKADPRFKAWGAPKLARVRTVLLEPTSFADWRKTGRYWRRSAIGPHIPPVRKDPDFWQNWLPEPELFHCEHHQWRRRTRLHRVTEAARRGLPTEHAISREAGDLPPDTFARFWLECWPVLRMFSPQEWQRLPDLQVALDKRFDALELRSFQRLLGRLCVVGLAALEPLYAEQKAQGLKVPNYGSLWFALLAAIWQGQPAFERVRRDPRQIAPFLEKIDLEVGAFMSVALRLDASWFEASKLRLIDRFLDWGTPEHAARVRAERIKLEPLSVFASMSELLKTRLAGPAFERDQPEGYPRYRLSAAGVMVRQAETSQIVLSQLGKALSNAAPPHGAALPHSAALPHGAAPSHLRVPPQAGKAAGEVCPS
jgi:hypothetical protein